MALDLGCTVAELGQRMGAAEFGRWKAFHALTESGARNSAERWACVMAGLYNGPMQKKSGGHWAAADFLPKPPRPAKRKPTTGADAARFLAQMQAG